MLWCNKSVPSCLAWGELSVGFATMPPPPPPPRNEHLRQPPITELRNAECFYHRRGFLKAHKPHAKNSRSLELCVWRNFDFFPSSWAKTLSRVVWFFFHSGSRRTSRVNPSFPKVIKKVRRKLFAHYSFSTLPVGILPASIPPPPPHFCVSTRHEL